MAYSFLFIYFAVGFACKIFHWSSWTLKVAGGLLPYSLEAELGFYPSQPWGVLNSWIYSAGVPRAWASDDMVLRRDVSFSQGRSLPWLQLLLDVVSSTVPGSVKYG